MEVGRASVNVSEYKHPEEHGLGVKIHCHNNAPRIEESLSHIHTHTASNLWPMLMLVNCGNESSTSKSQYKLIHRWQPRIPMRPITIIIIIIIIECLSLSCYVQFKKKNECGPHCIIVKLFRILALGISPEIDGYTHTSILIDWLVRFMPIR